MARAVKLRVAAWVLGGILGALVLFIALLHTPPVRRYALKQAIAILDRQGIRFRASNIDYNLLTLAGTLNSVEVRSPQAPDLPPLVQADQAYINLSLRQLLTGKYDIQDAVIRNPRLHLVIDKDGRDNVPHLPEQKDKKSKLEWFINRLLIQGGDLRVEDRRQQIDAELPIDQVTIAGNPITRNHDVELRAQQGGHVSWETRTMPLRNVNASVLLKEDSADVRSLNIGLGESTIGLSGTVNSFNDPRFDVRANTNLALGALTGFAGIRQNVQGTVNVDLAATGPVSAVKASARVAGKDLVFDRFRNVSLQAEIGYESASARAKLNSLNVVALGGTIHGQASFALNSNAGESSANLAANGVDLGTLTSALGAPVRVASRADAKIAVRWPGLHYEQAAGDATVKVAATRSTPAKNVLPVSGSLNVKTSGDRIVVGIPELRSFDASGTGQVVLTNRNTLGGEFRLESSNLSSTVASVEDYLGQKRGTLAGIPIAGTAAITAKLGGTIKAPSLTADASAPGMTVGTLKGVDFVASAKYDPDRLALNNASVTWRGETLTASGTVGLKGRSPALDLNARGDSIQVGTILAALDRTDIKASGALSLVADIKGTAKQPQADVRLTGTDLAAYNETLGQLTAQALVDGDVITVNELRLDKPQEGGNGSLAGSGTYNTQSGEYSLRAQTNNFRLTALQLPDGSPVRGGIDLKAEGKGNIHDPAGTLELTAKSVQVADQQYGDMNLTANVANRQANIQAAAPKFNLAANARIGTQQPYAATFEVKASGTDIATLPITLNQPLKGTVTATVHGTGNLENYEQGQAVAEVASLNLEWNGQPVRTEGPLVARYENQRLTIQDAVVVARNSRLALSGTLPLEPSAGEGAIKLSANLDFATLAPYLPSDLPVTAQGTATVDGSVRGTLKRIDPNVAITLKDGYFSTQDLPYAVSKVNLQAQVHDGALELASARANYGPATVTASGTVPFGLLPANLPVELPRRQGPAQFTAELLDLDLGSIEGAPEDMEGRLSARLEASASRPELEAITGRLTFPQLRVGIKKYALEQKGVSEILLANGTATVQNMQLTGPSTEVRLTGTAGLTGARPLNLKLDGKLDAAILSAFVRDVQAQGDTEIHVAVAGTATQPKATGSLSINDGQLSMRDPRIGVESLNARVDLAGNRATISRLDGVLNGGIVAGSGVIEYVNGQFRNTNLSVQANDVYLEYPEALKTISNVNIRLTSKGNQLIVGGQVVVQEGGYREDINIGSDILSRFTQHRGLDLTQERNPTLENVRFDLRIRTAEPILVDNNYGKLAINADLRLLGTPYEPGLSGRMTIEEGGELRLQERKYAVERGIVTFTNEQRIEPTLDLLATTTAAGYNISLQVSGEPGKTETTLTSDPSLPEPDILALLLTGKTMEQMRGQEFDVARNQILSYLTGSIGSRIGSSIAGATGLSMVRIEPNLIAAETDPSARLTVGQNITPNLDLIYSMDLINSSDQIYVAEYDITRRFTTRGTRQSDGSFRFDFRHDLRFGGTPEPRRGDKHEQRKIGKVNIIGEKYFSSMKIADKFGVHPGNRYDFFKIRKGMDRVQNMFAKSNLLESRVRVNRDLKGNIIDLGLTVKPGPIVDFVFEGASVPGGVQKKVRSIWLGGVFDTQRADEAVNAIKAWLIKDDHLQPKVEYTINRPTEERKRVVFDIQPGPRFRGVKIVFDGAKGLEPGDLRTAIHKQNLDAEVYTDPGRVTDLLTRFYREQGYLDAKVATPRYELNSETQTGQVVFPVQEGALFTIGAVQFEGNKAFTSQRLTEVVPLPKGEDYRPVLRENALQRLKEFYWDNGYADVDTDFVMTRSPDSTLDITFKITENRQSIVRDVVVQGREHTSESLVRTQVALQPGDVLSLKKLSDARRNLYRTGAYSIVDITREEVVPEGDEQTRARQTGEAGEKPIRLRVRVREIQPFQLLYGGFFDTERGPGGIIDLANRNSLGSARVLGLRARYDRQLREGRVYFSQPSLMRFPLKTIASPYIRMERNPATKTTDPFNVDRVGFSLQQELNLKKAYIFNYGYKIERSRTYDPSPEAIFDVPLRIAALTSTFTRETRDEMLDATHGSFMSHAIQYSPEVLGSQLRFIKYFGQYFKYFPLQQPRVEMFTNKVLRPRLVFASGARVGLAKGLGGQEVPLSERFFAGGGTTIRGFEQNSVGPAGFDRMPLGGSAMLVLNNEIRFPLVSLIDGVGFVDVGNVYHSVSDFSITDIRKAAGLGVRLRTPWFLLRLDYGFKLDRKPGEAAGRLFFSIGQAF